LRCSGERQRKSSSLSQWHCLHVSCGRLRAKWPFEPSSVSITTMSKPYPALVATALVALFLIAACSATVKGNGSAPISAAVSESADFPSASSPPSTSVAPTPTPSGPTQAQLISRFAGKWSGHGRALMVKVGIGAIDYRVYKWCSADPTPPCDEIQGNEIIDGGVITFSLQSSYSAGTATVAEGTVLSSTDPTLIQGQPLTARVQGYVLSLSVFPAAPSCSVNTPAAKWVCGA
jgi:hypothetical protein